MELPGNVVEVWLDAVSPDGMQASGACLLHRSASLGLAGFSQVDMLMGLWREFVNFEAERNLGSPVWWARVD